MIGQVEKQLMQWMNASMDLKNAKYTIPDEQEWFEFYIKIFEQGLGPAMFPLVAQIPENQRTFMEEFEPWKREIISAVTVQLYRLEQIKEILRVFDENNIPVIMFKGLAIARFYDNYENRLMSDMDILIQEKHKQEAVKVIEALGYRLDIDEDEHPMHLGFEKKGAVYIELHTSLFFPGYLNVKNLDPWYQHIWEDSRMITVDSVCFRGMAVEDELINQLLHFATHLVYAGGRLKYVYDIALLIKKNEQLNWPYVEDVLKKANLWDFGRFIFSLCHHYFNTSMPNAAVDAKQFTEDKFLYILIEENTDAGDPGHMVAWRYYSKRLPMMCKTKVLVPLVWLSEFYIQVKIHKLNLSKLWSASQRNMNLFTKKSAMIKGLGLSN